MWPRVMCGEDTEWVVADPRGRIVDIAAFGEDGRPLLVGSVWLPAGPVAAFGDALADVVWGAFSDEDWSSARAVVRPLDGMSVREASTVDARTGFFENDQTRVDFPSGGKIKTMSLGHGWRLPENWASTHGHLRPQDAVPVIDEAATGGWDVGDEIQVHFPSDGTTTAFTVDRVWRRLEWAWPESAFHLADQLKGDLYAALVPLGPVWGFVTVSDRIDPFEGLGYSMNDLDWMRSVSGYGWLTFIDHASAGELDDAVLESCVDDGLRVTELGASVAFELPDGPVSSPEWYDRVDELIAPVRVERRGRSRGHHTEATMRTLSALDSALCYTGDPLRKAATRHPDPLPFTDESRAERDEQWPDKHHRPPLSWYKSGEE
ncbi:MAG: hypothetical protein GY720_04730 [bacterium]|nr:hypothetical protein [bacterium]